MTDPAFVVVSGSDVTTPDVQTGVAQLVEQIEAVPETFFGPFENRCKIQTAMHCTLWYP